jgi:hypothetical protein
MRSTTRLIALVIAAVLTACGGGAADETETTEQAGPGPSGPTELAWTAETSGSPFKVVESEGAVVVGTESPVALTAYDTADGKVLWERQFEDATYVDHFGLVAGRDGPMLSYGTEDAGRLQLLEWETGDEVWGVDTEGDMYDMWADEADGLGFVSYDEYEGGWLDMSNGEQTPTTDEYIVDLGDQLARVGAEGLEVGFDPLHPAEQTETVPVDYERVDGENFVLADDLLVASDGSEVVGFVDGEERWRVDAGAGKVANLGLLGDHLLVAGTIDEFTLGPFAVVRVDGTSAEVLPGLPEGAELVNARDVGGRLYLVAALRGAGDTDETDEIVLMAAGDTLEELARFEAEGYVDTAWFVGERVALTNSEALSVAVRSLEDGQELATLPVGSSIVDALEGPDGYVVIYDDDQVSLHR